jgi:hypothetical protein
MPQPGRARLGGRLMTRQREPEAEEFMMQTAPVPTGMAVLEMAQAGRFAEIPGLFAPQLRAMVPAEALRAAWAAELGRRGPARRAVGAAGLRGS